MNTQAQTDQVTTSYEHLQKAAVVSGAAALSGCFNSANVSNDRSNSGNNTEQSLPAPNKERAARFLLQAGFSVQPSEMDYVVKHGYENWLDKQMRSNNDISAVDWLYSQGYNSPQFVTVGYSFTHMLWQQFLESKNELRKRMAFALSQILVVSIKGVSFEHSGFAMGYYWDLLNKHAFGNYRDLLEDITLSPAMGHFLSTRGNRNGILAAERDPDENYARELLQLFSIGLVELNIDGSAKKDANGNEIETYTNDDITELAHVFTGWEFGWHNNRSASTDATPAHTPMQLISQYHSKSALNIFGTRIPKYTNGYIKLKLALDTIFNHPNVAPFVSKQLIQRLVTSNPSPAYIARVAKVFNNNGKGIKGDLGATLKAILMDREARTDESLKDENFGKVREPALRLFQWAKTFKAASVSGKWQGPGFDHPAYGFAQAPMSAPSVFNFFRPGYVPVGSEFAQKKLTAPEIQIINETTAAAYYNNLKNYILHDVPHYKNETNPPKVEIKMEYSEFAKIAKNDSNALVDELNLRFTANQLSTDSLTIIKTAISELKSSTPEEVLNKVKSAVFLVMSSYDYLLQK